ncbi:MAG: glycosyltransferase family 2 protein, partial [Candidatus Aminicenantes bacterium]|nr:glycosyltransferase family 2 protein [Candidatus Aminicenantes bacterium]
LKNAIESILANNYKEIEILIINDNEYVENDILSLIKTFDDKRIHYHRNINTKGGNGARNTGILKAKGDIIAFLDEDDEYLPERLKKVYAKLQNISEDVGGCLTGFEYWDGIELKKYPEILDGDITKKILTENYNFGNSSNFVFKRDAIKKIGLWDEKLKRHQDFEYILRFLRFFKLTSINEVLLRINGHSTRPSSEIMINSKIRYFFKARHSIQKLNEVERNNFFYKQFKELYQQTAGEGKILYACFFYRKAKRCNSNIKKGIDFKFFLKLVLSPFFKVRFFLWEKYKLTIFFKKKHRHKYLKK